MDIDLFQYTLADIDESVWRAGLNHDDVAGHGLSDLVANHDASASLLHHENLIVFMDVQRSAPTGLRLHEEHRNHHIALVGADEMIRATNEG